MPELDIKIVKVPIDKKSMLANLLELYAYEFTEYSDLDIGDDGFYGYKYLSLYQTDPHRFPYFITVNDKIAGFTLVMQGSPISQDTEIWDVSEFFVIKKYKRLGTGTVVAHKIWEQYKGRWQVRVLQSNPRACSFWQQAIAKFTASNYKKFEQVINEENWIIYTFESLT